jgi:hypothetical protein
MLIARAACSEMAFSQHRRRCFKIPSMRTQPKTLRDSTRILGGRTARQRRIGRRMVEMSDTAIGLTMRRPGRRCRMRRAEMWPGKPPVDHGSEASARDAARRSRECAQMGDATNGPSAIQSGNFSAHIWPHRANAEQYPQIASQSTRYFLASSNIEM